MERSRRESYGHPRRSVEDEYSSHRRRNPIDDDFLGPEDFRDVFGGPPRTILYRYFYNGNTTSSPMGVFYEEVFRTPEKVSPQPGIPRVGRSLPEFKIPASDRNRGKREINRFYDDIFGWEGGCETLVRSRSRSMENSEALLSPDDPSSPRVYDDDDDDVFRFAAKLRPINVKDRRSDVGIEDHKNYPDPTPPFTGKRPLSGDGKVNTDNMRSYPFVARRRNGSMDTISIDQTSNCSLSVVADDLEPNSPSSGESSVYHSVQKSVNVAMGDKILDPLDEDLDYDDDELSSFFIEINSDIREETCESNGVDEAIAWAKEKFQTGSPQPQKESPKTVKDYQASEETSDSLGSWEEQVYDGQTGIEEIEQFNTLAQFEMQSLDQKISLWSDGKETDIRLLLCSLHLILWPKSGWQPVSLGNIIEISKVKKSFQRARLCLHPDKLQQRGATLAQKYLAEKAFSILQDAWSAFNLRGI